MSAGAGSRPGPFRTAYASALGDYLDDPTESSLRVAYELGREAVSRQLSVLDLTVIHQETVLSTLEGIPDVAKAQEFMRTAGDFFLESLASFEMVQRGINEVRQAFWNERRQTELSRQLSTFLADASLALDASDSLEEMLRLVVEQARELVGAECCVATVALEGRPRTAEAASHQETDPDTRWPAFVRWLDLSAIYQFIRLSGGSVRITGEQLTGLRLFRTAGSDRPLQGWLAASLTALDGGELGAIQLFDKPEGGFTREDEAALVHLAQMASAAVERTRLYRDRS
jgi:Phosphoserine phosphatase RsbU, N-terminal domain/GAF domain